MGESPELTVIEGTLTGDVPVVPEVVAGDEPGTTVESFGVVTGRVTTVEPDTVGAVAVAHDGLAVCWACWFLSCLVMAKTDSLKTKENAKKKRI